MTNTDTNRNLNETLVRLKSEFSKELTSLLEFWATKCVDETHGGFIGRMDHFGEIDTKASKGCILNTRILWTFSAAYRTTGKESYSLLATQAYDYIKQYFWDPVNGGLYWDLDFTGSPVSTKKQAYAQGFGLYAFSEFYRATGNEESLTYAKELYTILETKFWESKFGGYTEALTDDWKAMDDVRLSQKDLNTPKSMNTHLHILEPYTNLYRVWPNEKLKTSIASLLQIFCQKIFNSNTKHLKLFFSPDWKSQFEEVSFGHDIEAAWLMNEASKVIHKGVIEDSVHSVTRLLVEATKKEGLDKDGSIFYERHGAILDKHKHWWCQAEGMVGFMDAFELDGNKSYIQEVQLLWTFIKNWLKDEKNGEWFWRVDEHNQPIDSEDKVGFWKGPYHNGRALMELIERIDKQIQVF